MDVDDVVHLILLVNQRDMTANGDVPVAGCVRRLKDGQRS
jgi:hypothetical protein